MLPYFFLLQNSILKLKNKYERIQCPVPALLKPNPLVCAPHWRIFDPFSLLIHVHVCTYTVGYVWTLRSFRGLINDTRQRQQRPHSRRFNQAKGWKFNGRTQELMIPPMKHCRISTTGTSLTKNLGLNFSLAGNIYPIKSQHKNN